jgi:hypothetical protein
MKPMRSRGIWILVAMGLMSFGCATLTPRALLELSEREGQFYRELQPALVEAGDTFRITADALITRTVSRQAAIMHREAAPVRKVLYESLAKPDPPAGRVEKAIKDLVEANTAVEVMIDKQKEAAQLRVQAITETFEALDMTLGAIKENQQAIHSYLVARKRIFGGPGKSAFLPFSTYAELKDYLREAVKNLEEQFKLAKEIVDAAEEEFGNQGKTHEALTGGE